MVEHREERLCRESAPLGVVSQCRLRLVGQHSHKLHQNRVSLLVCTGDEHVQHKMRQQVLCDANIVITHDRAKHAEQSRGIAWAGGPDKRQSPCLDPVTIRCRMCIQRRIASARLSELDDIPRVQERQKRRKQSLWQTCPAPTHLLRHSTGGRCVKEGRCELAELEQFLNRIRQCCLVLRIVRGTESRSHDIHEGALRKCDCLVGIVKVRQQDQDRLIGRHVESIGVNGAQQAEALQAQHGHRIAQLAARGHSHEDPNTAPNK